MTTFLNMRRFPFKEGHHYLVASNGCWVWLRARKGKEAADGGGYGCIRVKGKLYGAHVLACEYKHGPMNGRHARHLCHNTLCVNPTHLQPGTNADNQRDSCMAGQRQKKLTPQIVLDIRARCAAGESQSSIGKRYEIAQADVSHILHRHWWAHV
jgi:hypothetical protein